jgi:hypothetical protein
MAEGFVKLKIYWNTRKQGCEGQSCGNVGKGGVSVRATIICARPVFGRQGLFFRKCNVEIEPAMLSRGVSMRQVG